MAPTPKGPEGPRPRSPEANSPFKKAKERISKTQLIMAKGLSVAFEFVKKGVYQVAPWTKRILGGLGLGVLGAMWRGFIPFVNQMTEIFFPSQKTNPRSTNSKLTRKPVSV